MKKIVKTLLFLLIFLPFMLSAKENNKDMNMYLFYGEGCPHCKALEEYLNVYLKENDNIHLYRYEVWHNDDNLKKLTEIIDLMDVKDAGIPFLIIGNNAIVGYDSEYTQNRIKNTVNYYSNVKYKDNVGIYLGLVEDNQEDEDNSKYDNEEVNIPLLGKKNIKDVSIVLSAVLIGLVDGFNPCAMWILLFLISMLLSMKDKKRRWILGITFLVSSALVYFLFLISWLNLATFLNSVTYIRIAIAFAAIVFGIISIVRFIKGLMTDDGCEVVDTKNRKRIIVAIRKIVKQESFFLAILGIILLAASVNVIELLCSLGLPVMFSEILTINGVNTTMKIVYSLIYIFFFLIDDIIIFVIAMKTLEIKAISNKFGKYAHLIGGLIMLIIGFLMIYKPEWLMFNF